MDKKEPHKKMHKGMLIFYIGCGLVLLMAFSLMTFRMSLNSQLNAKLDEIRATGYPTTLAELNDYYPAVPDAENAAEIYHKAFQLLHGIDDKIFKQKNKALVIKEEYGKINKQSKTFKELVVIAGDASKPILGERLSQASVTDCKKFVAANSECIDKLKVAALLSKCRFPVDFQKLFLDGVSYLVPLRGSVRLLSVVTILAAGEGNKKQVVKNILTMVKICHALDNEPLALSYIVKLSMLSRTVETLEYAISLIELDDDSLLMINKALKASLDKNGHLLNRALAGERGISLNFKPTDNLRNSVSRLTGVLTLNKLKILEIHEEVLAMDTGNINRVRQHKLDSQKEKEEISFFYYLAKEVIGYQNPVLYKKLILEARIKGAIIGIAIERYRLKYRKLPVKLTQLEPEFIKTLPNDPFTQKPFSYVIGDITVSELIKERKSGGSLFGNSNEEDLLLRRAGWMIYSYGLDEKDDNGIPNGILSYSIKTDDIPFRCVRKNN